MFTPRQAARSMIELATAKGLEVTHLRVQKLLYFSHGLVLARHSRPLVNEAFQAWRFGPVIQSLYYDLKIFGTTAITPAGGFIGQWEALPASATDEAAALEAVLAQLGQMSSSDLISYSHAENGPWHGVYNNKARSNIEIGNADIEKYFKTIVN